ncbi:hypothetical protein J5Y04_07165 [Kitasatospora sp. RG8]|uniref:hypothetical protein n=1 Tax=Kitasatospora sp. RG8 TaxID=2820815 RepID=UPI001ADF1E0B|nr:hypothetical protein [Kitasatospora sp. RG8]MBP0449330.1 hypothetical protein [Kitasatospora sp. RG8]
MGAASAAGLVVTRAVVGYPGGRSETSLDPDLRVFVSDLVRPYGLPLREDLLAEGVGHSYEEMAEGLLREALADGRPVDLLILAFDSPDVRPGAPSSLALSRSCPGEPLAFALCDQGSAAAFSALRVAAEYHRTGACRRAVVVLAEQTALHYRAAEPVDLPERHCAVVLVCDEAAGGELMVDQIPVADVKLASKTVGEAVRDLGEGAAVLLGPGLVVDADADVRAYADVRVDPAAAGVDGAARATGGQPFTGIWSELAERLPAWRAEGRPVLAAGFDRRLGVLSTLTLRAGP